MTAPSTARLPALTVAPMEGLTGAVFQRLHRRYFGGADSYYLPFITPTREPRFTARQARDLTPRPTDREVVPQLLTDAPQKFVWAALALADMGYREVNLNLGCPAGTVTARGRGAAFLRRPVELDAFLRQVLKALDGRVAVSVKTRLGWSDPTEFAALAEVFSRHPIARLIVHPRLRSDLFRGAPRWDILRAALADLTVPLGINGDLATPADLSRASAELPEAVELMVGRGILGDPALLRRARGGPPADAAEVLAFTAELFEGYAAAFGQREGAASRLKEYWSYLSALFVDGERLLKPLFKARRAADYLAAVAALGPSLVIRNQPSD